MIQKWIFLMYAGRFDHLLEPCFHFLSECWTRKTFLGLSYPLFFFKEIQARLYGGPCCSGRGVRTNNRFPCSLRGASLFFMGVGRVGVCSGVWPEGWLRWFAHPLGCVEYRGQAQYPAFAPGSSEVAVQLFFGLFVSFVQNLLQLCTHSYF